jgi:hypothetical protein
MIRLSKYIGTAGARQGQGRCVRHRTDGTGLPAYLEYMKRFVVPAILLLAASSALFAFGTQVAKSSHAQNGFDHKDMVVVMVSDPAEAKRVWLVATHSFPLLLAERDRLLDLVKAASRKIDIAVTNRTTLSYQQELGAFYTDNAALVTVSFDTEGYEASYVVVRITGNGNSVFLRLNKKDTGDFIASLGAARSLADDYQRQSALFE